MTRRFAATGDYRVCFTFNNSVEEARRIEKEFPGTEAIACDFTDPNSLDHLLSRMGEMNLDILVNNALTGMKTKHFHQSDPDGFLSSFAENVMPTLRITQQAIKEFRKKKSGRIITVLTSYLANRPPLGLSEYVANKAYLLSLSRSWAEENMRHNITSNCVSPSMMKTSLISHLDDRQVEEIANGNPLKRLVTTEEVSDAVFFLASASRHINGVNFLINGGVDVV
ncbi:3-hydroxybutyrate dehydrogenase/3-oxoacyl-[acyl-carrier protein] reductase [Methylobacter tundripaludum]|uniref:3-hydroxybutyrate dehydrogenase/3-oxoacyl-[acyl-carrier protein] reductase n=2 Tax=Methylobacter tundripaludum TaxID=173365 RepID=A0A2S6H9I9_9GAMM|nr:3-hydroxybutyrate dehydrogenase/3-oxoacyl-[acyl-carrier protein] reductase [Methylobacter tundripaludum]